MDSTAFRTLLEKKKKHQKNCTIYKILVGLRSRGVNLYSEFRCEVFLCVFHAIFQKLEIFWRGRWSLKLLIAINTWELHWLSPIFLINCFGLKNVLYVWTVLTWICLLVGGQSKNLSRFNTTKIGPIMTSP